MDLGSGCPVLMVEFPFGNRRHTRELGITAFVTALQIVKMYRESQESVLLSLFEVVPSRGFGLNITVHVYTFLQVSDGFLNTTRSLLSCPA